MPALSNPTPSSTAAGTADGGSMSLPCDCWEDRSLDAIFDTNVSDSDGDRENVPRPPTTAHRALGSANPAASSSSGTLNSEARGASRGSSLTARLHDGTVLPSTRSALGPAARTSASRASPANERTVSSITAAARASSARSAARRGRARAGASTVASSRGVVGSPSIDTLDLDSWRRTVRETSRANASNTSNTRWRTARRPVHATNARGRWTTRTRSARHSDSESSEEESDSAESEHSLERDTGGWDDDDDYDDDYDIRGRNALSPPPSYPVARASDDVIIIRAPPPSYNETFDAAAATPSTSHTPLTVDSRAAGGARVSLRTLVALSYSAAQGPSSLAAQATQSPNAGQRRRASCSPSEVEPNGLDGPRASKRPRYGDM
ncbi:unnamed protein product [Peniophora sp. CBMAI 1063]|nr:unnamed protein product [Peniophora sp. CBMAI 1063]